MMDEKECRHVSSGGKGHASAKTVIWGYGDRKGGGGHGKTTCRVKEASRTRGGLCGDIERMKL
jgi:hypothetical protein